MGSDEELEDEDEDEKNLNNDMSDLKDDDESSDEENTINKEADNNKSTKLFTQKLKEKKVIMDEARKQLPYTFTGNEFNIKKCYYVL